MNIKKPFIISTLLVVSIPLWSQKIDSLKSLLTGRTEKDRVNILFELARQYSIADSSAELILRYSEEGYRIARKIQDSLMIIKTGRIIASNWRNIGQIDAAITLYKLLLPISRKNDNADVTYILNGLGIAYTDRAQFDSALHYHFQCSDFAQQISDSFWSTVSLNNIGITYYKLKDYLKALKYFRQSAEIKRKIKDLYDLDLALINMGLCYAYLGDYINAELHVEEGLKVCGSGCSSSNLINADFAMGVIHFGMKELNKAENYFLKSYLLAKATKNIRFQFDDIDYLSQIYILQNRIDKAIYYLNRAEGMIKQNISYNLELIKIYSQFSQLYRKAKNYKMVSFYQQKYIQLKDSIFNEQLTTNLMKIESEYLERKNTELIASQKQVLKLKEDVIQYQQLINIFIGGIVVMLILLSAILLKSNRQKQIVNKILDERVKERTIELEESHHALTKNSKEKDILIERTTQEINSSLATLKGLCSVGLQDISDPNARQYIVKVEKTSDGLYRTLNLLRNKGE